MTAAERHVLADLRDRLLAVLDELAVGDADEVAAVLVEGALEQLDRVLGEEKGAS